MKILNSVGKNLIGFIVGVVLTSAILVLFLYVKLGKIDLQKTYEDYYISRMNLPRNAQIAKTFTGDIHGIKQDSSVFLTRGKSAFFYGEKQKADPIQDNSRIIIFDESFPRFWEILSNQMVSPKTPTFRFLPIAENSKRYVEEAPFSEPGMSPLEAYDLEVVDLDNNNIKEIVSFWIDIPGGSFALLHPVIIYWDGRYRVTGMPPIPKEEVVKTGYENVEVRNYFDGKVYKFPTLTNDDLLFFKDINDDGYVELVRGLIIWGENETHIDPHQYLFEVFTWKRNSWEPMYWKNTNEPYFISPKLDLPTKVDKEGFLEEYLSKYLYLNRKY